MSREERFAVVPQVCPEARGRREWLLFVGSMLMTLTLASCLGSRPTTVDGGGNGGNAGSGGKGGSAGGGGSAGTRGTHPTGDGGSAGFGGAHAGGTGGGAPDGGNPGGASGAGGMRDAGAGDTPACASGGSCPISDCETGTWTCTQAGRVCKSTTQAKPGSPCGSADAGASVCNSGGQCVACNAGGDCSMTSSPCVRRAYDCSSGAPVCTVTGNVADGHSCGTGLYCNGGVCGSCLVGAGCSPASNPCHVGKVTACSAGAAMCTDQGTAVAPGSPCSSGATTGVCNSSGACVACSTGAQCNPNGNVCQTGTQTCAAGPACSSLTNVREGQSCGTGAICHQGACVACSATSCTNGCCSSGGCVTAAQTTSSCGNGAPGGACGVCASPASGTGAAICSANACGVTCSGSTPNYCVTGNSCVNLQTDNANCGTCGTSCGAGTKCAAGQCVCNTSSGCSGCCSNSKTCVTGRTVTSCGVGGAACMSCLTGASCGVSGGGGVCACPANQLACGNTCTDTSGDGNNCGSCGHSCQGGGCLAGKCQATHLAPAFQPGGLAIDSQYVYWTNNSPGNGSGSIQRVPLGGGTVSTIVPNLTAGLTLLGVAVDATSVYWVDVYGSSIFKAPKAGGSETAIASGSPWAMCLSASFVYWIDTDLEAIMRTPISGAASTIIAEASDRFANIGSLGGITANANTVFWTTSLSAGTVQFDSVTAMHSMPAITIIQPAAMPTSMAIDATNVYWLETGSVMALALSGGSPRTLVTGHNPSGAIASDGTNVYFGDLPSGGGNIEITRVPVAGGAATPVAPGLDGVDAIAVDSAAIYWADTSGQLIFKVVK